MQREEKTRSSAAELAIDDGIVGNATGTKECISTALCPAAAHRCRTRANAFSAQNSSETPCRHAWRRLARCPLTNCCQARDTCDRRHASWMRAEQRVEQQKQLVGERHAARPEDHHGPAWAWGGVPRLEPRLTATSYLPDNEPDIWIADFVFSA